jgi:hypothetical protein
MAPRKPKGWTPPPGLTIEVTVTRGDVQFRAESTPADALNVSRLLTVMARHITEDAPDLLPHADTVPGAVLPFDWAEDAEGRKRTKRVGF